MSSFVVNNYMAMFSALSVSFDGGNGSVKRRAQTFATFSSHLCAIGYMMQTDLCVSDPNSCYESEKLLGISTAEFLEWYSIEYSSEN